MAAGKYLVRAGVLGALMMAALVITSGPLAAQTQASFSPPTNFPAGSSPFSVTTADFDGDGSADIATANEGSNDVSVLLGDGGGGFSPPTNFPAGSNPITATTADFDGDGSADIATANNFSNDVSVLLNTTNVPPVAVDDTYTVNEDGTLSTAAPGVLGNDTDANSDLPTARVVDNVQHGTLTLNLNGSFTYVPGGNFNGSDSFTYKANDGTANSNVATVRLSVNAVNDAPVAEDDSATTDEDTPANINVIPNDTDVDNTNAELSVSSFTQPSNGMVTQNADGTLTYAPDSDFNGTDSFTYEVCDDGDPALCATATVTMTVSPVPDACTIKGTGKDDVLRGTANRDVICGGGGNDTVYGRGGNDFIRGGVGKDTIHGDAGDDTLYGGDGRDELHGDEGDDRLYGGAGTDLLNGGSGTNFTQQ